MTSRPVRRTEIDRVSETLTLAFQSDPVWGVALARPDGSTAHHNAYWRQYIDGAFRYGTVFTMDDASAVSVWIPPGGTELSTEQEAVVVGLVEGALQPVDALALFGLWDRFDANHPRGEPHAYLSLLATHPNHRGKGSGQRLLADDLARFDADGVPAYLESTNPGNDHRYERAGFRRIGGFEAVIDGAPISTMWRPVQGSARPG